MAEDPDESTSVSSMSETRSLPKSWRPFMREADLTRTSLATGLNALTKANHLASGYYSQAFFNVSVGLERMLKLIFIIDYALTHRGELPSDNVLQTRFRHDLTLLFHEAVDIRARLMAQGRPFQWSLVDEELAGRIIKVLAEFAKATRYYNLDYLAGRNPKGRDPIKAWADDVSTYLAAQHPARLRQRAQDWAAFVEEAVGGHLLLLHETEGGEPLRTVAESSLHGRVGEWVQQAATFHTATIVRYLVEILSTLSDQSYPGAVIELPFLWEFFGVFLNEDKYLRFRRTFLT